MLKLYQRFNIHCSHHCQDKYEVEEGTGLIYMSHSVSKSGGLESEAIQWEGAMWLKGLEKRDETNLC
jgi:hypothetical protein